MRRSYRIADLVEGIRQATSLAEAHELAEAAWQEILEAAKIGGPTMYSVRTGQTVMIFDEEDM